MGGKPATLATGSRRGSSQGVVSPLARSAGRSARIGYCSQLSSRLRKPAEQLGEHSSGVGG